MPQYTIKGKMEGANVFRLQQAFESSLRTIGLMIHTFGNPYKPTNINSGGWPARKHRKTASSFEETV